LRSEEVESRAQANLQAFKLELLALNAGGFEAGIELRSISAHKG
jgi:hypothetical protein